MRHLSIDLETYSGVNLEKSGLYKYVQSGDFEILLLAYCFEGGNVGIVDLAQGERIPTELRHALTDPETVKHAFNAAFEWYCLAKYLQIEPVGYLPQWRCTQLHSLYCGLTAGLAATGEAIGLPQEKRKLDTGKELIRVFSIPGKRGRVFPTQEPEKWQLFKTYCKQDVVTEMEIERRLSVFPVPDFVQKEWELDMRINLAGVRLDVDLIEGAVTFAEAEKSNLTEEAKALTGLQNPNSIPQLKHWIEGQTGQTIPSLDKEAVTELLGSVTNPRVRRALELRQLSGKSSVSKYQRMIESVCQDERARGLLQFYGAARTGRWAGRLIQVQNLPRNYLDELDFARELVKQGDAEMLELVFGSIPDTLSQLIRTAFIPSPGCKFVVADYAAIEARVIAWLAGEQWRQDVFRTHGKIYEASASAMFGVPMERIKKGNPEYALRAKGKVAELALGYGGGISALVSMGALKMGLQEEELGDIVQRWRHASPNIVRLWHRLESAAKQTLRTGQPTGVAGCLFRYEGDYTSGLRFLTVQLPSGRRLFYLNPYFGEDRFGGESIHYYCVGKGGEQIDADTYGGKLTENIVQAIARDCLSLALQRIEWADLQTVMHIHDEVVLDVPEQSADLRKVCRLMCEPIPWAPGLLLNAAGFMGDYYKKD